MATNRVIVWTRLPLVLALLASACSLREPDTARSADDEVTLTLQRHPCMGSCPVYAVSVNSHGDVEYEGFHYVRARGTQHSHVDPDEVRALFDRIAKADVFAEPDGMVHCFDEPKGVLTLKHHGVVREARFSQVPECNGKLGARLPDIAKAIDEVLEADAWTVCTENANGECFDD